MIMLKLDLTLLQQRTSTRYWNSTDIALSSTSNWRLWAGGSGVSSLEHWPGQYYFGLIGLEFGQRCPYRHRTKWAATVLLLLAILQFSSQSWR